MGIVKERFVVELRVQCVPSVWHVHSNMHCCKPSLLPKKAHTPAVAHTCGCAWLPRAAVL